MTTARLDRQIRTFDFVKLAVLVALATLLGLLAYSAAVGLQPSLARTNYEAVAGELFLMEGAGEQGRTIIVQAGSDELGRAIVNDGGQWAIEVAAPNRPALYNVILQNQASPQNVTVYGALRVLDPVQAQATDEAEVMFDSAENDQVNQAVETIIAEVDLPAFEMSPNLSANPNLLADGSLDVNGYAAPNATVDVMLDGQIVYMFSADDDGSWSGTLDVEEVGSHTINFIVTDQNGTVNTTEPITFTRYQAPTIEYTPTENGVPNEVAFQGTAEERARVGIEVNDSMIAITRADSAGNWRWVGKLPSEAGAELQVKAVLLDEENVPLVFGPAMALSLVDSVAAESADGEEEVMVEEEAVVADPVEESTEEEMTEEVMVETDPPAQGLAALKLPDALASEGRFNTLYAALDLTGNIYTLKLDEKFSIFAPTDEAFGRLPERVLLGWQNDVDALRQVLLHHLVKGELYTADLPVRGMVKTAANTNLILSNVGGVVEVEDVLLDKSDVTIANGVIHEISTVLMPPTDFVPTRIDTSGVSNFQGSELTIVGTGEIGAAIIVEMNGEPFGVAKVDNSGYWTVPGNIVPGEYTIIAYALDDNDILQNISEPVELTVTE